MNATFTRVLGKSGIQVSAMGLGCWAIGGPFTFDGKTGGWGQVDDSESIRAIHRALDLGITFFDTADVYGTGRSERVLARALEGYRNKAVIATKFGYTYDEERREVTGQNASPAYIRRACEASLRRLKTDYIDLYQLHTGWLPVEQAETVAVTLEALQAEGNIRAYGWSTDTPDSVRLFATKPHCMAIQHALNVFQDAGEIIALCEEHSLTSINRDPLAMGFLSGKFSTDSRLPVDDVRGSGHNWIAYFRDGKPRQEFLDKLDAIRAILTSNGRSLVQGALAWIWGRSQQTVPIPGFKSLKQVEENVKALHFGPLSADQMHEIDVLLLEFRNSRNS
ncbi:MAG: aldo/keto reductase [Syntrophobacteraceae bacterium CG23_combo_of_CG06-09_8_20_14_all_50_8]|nr:MAG: aldo/keto reductase [Syntrophobacteraceae bacterium CG23_combo_of_CG06-09_8_20_14_all_50_8]